MIETRALIGKPVARNINENTLESVLEFSKKYNRVPKLSILASHDASARSYLRTIKSTSKVVGAEYDISEVESGWDTDRVASVLAEMSSDVSVDGILVQEPLPDGVSMEIVGQSLDPVKDIDGITSHQSGLLFRGAENVLAPPTARAVIEILDYYRFGLKGQQVVVLGRSLVVGKPVGILALSRHATVTWCHSRTQSLQTVCKRADILIVAVGRARMVNAQYIRPGATVIDVGINVDEKGKLCGDVDEASISTLATAYTPVPRGVGPVTTACLYDNLLKAARNRMTQV